MNDTATDNRTVSLVIAALGGEGGGVLTDWIVSAATAAGLPVQSTSIPGVAQRTGATTYYIEIFPRALDPDSDRWPVMGLYPKPGNLDILVASELLEAGRGLANGWITPDRTSLIASTHRHYAIAEKSAMGDGRFDIDAIRSAAGKLAKQLLLADYRALAEAEGTVINAVLLGAIAATGQLPLTEDHLASAIRAKGIAVESSLAGFSAGMAAANTPQATVAEEPVPTPLVNDATLGHRIDNLPAAVKETVVHGANRLIDYQDTHYAALYLSRIEAVVANPRCTDELATETARHLALWMSYEDIIRVADLKSREARRQRVRQEVRAASGELVQITDFFKPGAEEISDVLPATLGRRLRSWANGRKHSRRISLRIRSDTVSGYLKLRFLGQMKKRRPSSLRFHEEHALMDRWLHAIDTQINQGNPAFALEIVRLASLNKGYGDTFRRGRSNFTRLFEYVDMLAKDPAASEKLALARRAALADPDGSALGNAVDAFHN